MRKGSLPGIRAAMVPLPFSMPSRYVWGMAVILDSYQMDGVTINKWKKWKLPGGGTYAVGLFSLLLLCPSVAFALFTLPLHASPCSLLPPNVAQTRGVMYGGGVRQAHVHAHMHRCKWVPPDVWSECTNACAYRTVPLLISVPFSASNCALVHPLVAGNGG